MTVLGMAHRLEHVLLQIGLSRLPDFSLLGQLPLPILHNVLHVFCSHSDHLHEVSALDLTLFFVAQLLPSSQNLLFFSRNLLAFFL